MKTTLKRMKGDNLLPEQKTLGSFTQEKRDEIIIFVDSREQASSVTKELFEKECKIIMKQLEETVPATNMYLDVSNGHFESKKNSDDTEKAFLDIKKQIEIGKDIGMDVKNLANAFINTELYCQNLELKALIREEYKI
jgi:hypothetical protein